MEKKRGYHCSNCRETIADEGVKKIAIGTDRSVVFCNECNCYVTLEEPHTPAAPPKNQQPTK